MKSSLEFIGGVLFIFAYALACVYIGYSIGYSAAQRDEAARLQALIEGDGAVHQGSMPW